MFFKNWLLISSVLIGVVGIIPTVSISLTHIGIALWQKTGIPWKEIQKATEDLGKWALAAIIVGFVAAAVYQLFLIKSLPFWPKAVGIAIIISFVGSSLYTLLQKNDTEVMLWEKGMKALVAFGVSCIPAIIIASLIAFIRWLWLFFLFSFGAPVGPFFFLITLVGIIMGILGTGGGAVAETAAKGVLIIFIPKK